MGCLLMPQLSCIVVRMRMPVTDNVNVDTYL